MPEIADSVRRMKTFRGGDRDQLMLLPPSLEEWLPQGHVARFLRYVVEGSLDLDPLYQAHTVTDGFPPYDPAMMLTLLLFAYSSGVTSSREIERRCEVDVAFRWICVNEPPTHRSVSRFRRRHEGALQSLFTQVLSMCASAGLVSLSRFALDGTKLRADASRHFAMSHSRMEDALAALGAEVSAMLATAEEEDTAEDLIYGEDGRGGELPEELRTKEGRIKRIKEAKEAIEAEARSRARNSAEERETAKGSDPTRVTEAGENAANKATPSPKAQRSFSDPDSKMMKTNDGFHYAYNA